MNKENQKGCGIYKYKDKNPFEEVNPCCGELDYLCPTCKATLKGYKKAKEHFLKKIDEKQSSMVPEKLNKLGNYLKTHDDKWISIADFKSYEDLEELKNSLGGKGE